MSTIYEEAEPKQIRHQVIVHPRPFKLQPTGKEMGMVTNQLKQLYSESISITKIIDYFSKGHCIILSNAEIDQNNSFQFISSSLFAIDIDDEERRTDPNEILANLKDQVVGLFYTFSHGIKGNRYRLVFQLDRSVTDESKMKGIIEVVAEDLKKMGLPVDVQAKNTTVPIRGGRKGYLIANAYNQLNTTELLERVKRETIKRQQEIYRDFEKNLKPVPFSVLKEMAQTIGYISSGSGQTDLWNRLTIALKHYADAGFITQDEGFELFDIISGGEQTQRDWENKRASGKATIGSFIHEAKQRGYKGKYNFYAHDEAVEEKFERETIKIPKDKNGNSYIPVEVAAEIIQSNQSVLIDSSTGSGKTSASINAFKKMERPNNQFYIMAMPTIALVDQNAKKHGVMAIKGQTKDLFKRIYAQVKFGRRIFICTYDMTSILVDFLREINPLMRFSLVVDELHKFVTDYSSNYRYEAIKSLYSVSKQAKTFVGLSGTVDDIYKNEFDKVVRIENGQAQSPCVEFSVYTYEKRKDCLPELAKLIETWVHQRKLLIYIQSKEKIEQLKQVLIRKGIKVRVINASSKGNHTYRQLVEQEIIDPDVQVVLTTSVIADGVNILNDLEWETIVVCNEFSNLFNSSSVKQISNRLRNAYRRFSLFMQEPKNEDQEPFNIEHAYQYRYRIAKNIVDEINQHPYFDVKLFLKSKIEKRFGIEPGVEGLEIDTLLLRHSVSVEQERYYSGHRFAFVKAVERILHTPLQGVLNVTEAIREKQLELTIEQELFEELAERKKLNDQEKSEAISKSFTRKIYEAFQKEDEAVLKLFKQAVVKRHYDCLARLTKVARYETCKKAVVTVKRIADTHAVFNRVRDLHDVIYYQALLRPHKTKDVLESFLQLNEFMVTDDYKQALEGISKRLKLPIKDIKEVESMVRFEHKKGSKGKRMKRVDGAISVQSVADEFGMTTDEVKEMVLNYAKLKGGTYESVVRSSIDRY